MTFTCPNCRAELRLLPGEPLDLTLTEHRLFSALRARPAQYMARDELLTEALDWPMTTVQAAKTATVRVHISRIRRKLEASNYPGAIESMQGRGYRLMPRELT